MGGAPKSQGTLPIRLATAATAIHQLSCHILQAHSWDRGIMMLEGLITGELLAAGDRFASELCCGSLSYEKVTILTEFAPSDLK